MGHHGARSRRTPANRGHGNAVPSRTSRFESDRRTSNRLQPQVAGPAGVAVALRGHSPLRGAARRGATNPGVYCGAEPRRRYLPMAVGPAALHAERRRGDRAVPRNQPPDDRSPAVRGVEALPRATRYPQSASSPPCPSQTRSTGWRAGPRSKSKSEPRRRCRARARSASASCKQGFHRRRRSGHDQRRRAAAPGRPDAAAPERLAQRRR